MWSVLVFLLMELVRVEDRVFRTSGASLVDFLWSTNSRTHADLVSFRLRRVSTLVASSSSAWPEEELFRRLKFWVLGPESGVLLVFESGNDRNSLDFVFVSRESRSVVSRDRLSRVRARHSRLLLSSLSSESGLEKITTSVLMTGRGMRSYILSSSSSEQNRF